MRTEDTGKKGKKKKGGGTVGGEEERKIIRGERRRRSKATSDRSSWSEQVSDMGHLKPGIMFGRMGVK